jgi:hypothetical protein
MPTTFRSLIALCFMSILALGNTGVYASSCPDNSATYPSNGCSLPGLVTGSFPYFQQGVSVDYKIKNNKTTFDAKYRQGSDSLFLTSSTDIYTITSTNYKLKATWDNSGSLSGTVKINGILSGLTPDPVKLMTADLTGDWNISGEGKLIGFNTTNIYCDDILPVLCTNAEVVYINLEDALDMAIDKFSTNGMALTSVPVPAAVWLFGSGVLGLASVARRKRKTA